VNIVRVHFECNLIANKASRGKNKGADIDVTHPLTDTHRRKNKEAIVCLIGPGLHHVGFHENTRLSKQTGGNPKEHSNTSY